MVFQSTSGVKQGLIPQLKGKQTVVADARPRQDVAKAVQKAGLPDTQISTLQAAVACPVLMDQNIY